MKQLFRNSAFICIFITGVFSVWLCGNLGGFSKNKITFDVISYHSYLPALFVEKDIRLQFYKGNVQHLVNEGRYWANFTKDGEPIIKTTYGLSAMYFPFTVWPLLFSNPEHGYEIPFSIAISISNLVYYLLSLFLLWGVLHKLKFSNLSIGLSILCVGLGSNLLSYASIAVGMPHAYNFFLVTALLYLYLNWEEEVSLKGSLLIGLVLGLMVLIRPTNSVFTLILFSKHLNKNFVTFMAQRLLHFALIALVAFTVILPQLLYWKMISGHYVYNSYVDEHFYFSNPHIWQYLFGFRKGWFIYSPLILLGLYGLIKYRTQQPFSIVSIIIIAVFIYLNSSWWCWWFGGSHGARAMIETYPLLAVGFAACFEFIKDRFKKPVWYVCGFLILFNLKSVDLYRANIIHFDSMTPRAFAYTTFKLFFSEEDKAYLKTLYRAPDYQKALRGEDT
jgi:hypothetical protein